MKKKVITIIAAILVLATSVGAFAYVMAMDRATLFSGRVESPGTGSSGPDIHLTILNDGETGDIPVTSNQDDALLLPTMVISGGDVANNQFVSVAIEVSAASAKALDAFINAAGFNVAASAGNAGVGGSAPAFTDIRGVNEDGKFTAITYALALPTRGEDVVNTRISVYVDEAKYDPAISDGDYEIAAVVSSDCDGSDIMLDRNIQYENVGATADVDETAPERGATAD